MNFTSKWAGPMSLVLTIFLAVPQASAQIAPGTVMASTGNGKVSMFSPDGTFLGQLDTTTGTPFIAGSVFDSAGNFYVTDFFAQAVTKFDPTGTLIGSGFFGSGYNANPESVTLDAAGNIYVGQADGSHQVLKFNSGGNPLANFLPQTEDRGTDWIELGADQCTLYYTSESVDVLRFNICTPGQLTPFASSLPDIAYAHKLRPNGEMLVADTSSIVRLSPVGVVMNQYLQGASPQLFALTLDPDGTSFWTGDLSTGQVFRVDIESGQVLKTINTGASGLLSGLSVKGEFIIAQGNKCPLSQGFWKNHAWPPGVTTLTLGTQTYAKAQLLSILNTPPQGDASLALADQLIAAKLDIAHGSNSGPVGPTIADADNLLSEFSGPLPYHVPSSSAVGKQMVNDANTLIQFNNGGLSPNCTP
jgi:sugar lactone lactonase YvrE